MKEANDDHYYIVNKIEPFNDKSIYYATSNNDFFYYMDNIEFIQENGKFAIGDTIYINFSNKRLELDSLNKLK